MAKRLNDYYHHNDDNEEEQQIISSVAQQEDDLIRIREKSDTTGARAWSFLRPLIILLISVFIVAGVVYYAINYVKSSYLDPVDLSNKSEKAVVIEKGSSLSDISKLLEEEGIIRNHQIFKLYVDFSDNSSKLKAGTYLLSPSMDFDDIIYRLRKGFNTDPTGKITLLEGLSAEDFAAVLAKDEFLASGDEYTEMAKTGEGEGLNITSGELKEIVQNNSLATEKRKYVLEGYLFPDTYEFFVDTSAAIIINKQLSRFYDVISSTDYTRALELGMNIDEVVTLASIIEKEAQDHDFKKVSAVLHNRLERDMPLQCDSTMAYALGIKNRIVLTDEELQRSKQGDDEAGSATMQEPTISPYNTDQRKGLPIGPICNPSKAAINAALYPDEELTKEGYLFFASTYPEPDENGKLYLVFNKDLDAHNEAVAEYGPLWEAYDRKTANGE